MAKRYCPLCDYGPMPASAASCTGCGAPMRRRGAVRSPDRTPTAGAQATPPKGTPAISAELASPGMNEMSAATAKEPNATASRSILKSRPKDIPPTANPVPRRSRPASVEVSAEEVEKEIRRKRARAIAAKRIAARKAAELKAKRERESQESLRPSGPGEIEDHGIDAMKDIGQWSVSFTGDGPVVHGAKGSIDPAAFEPDAEDFGYDPAIDAPAAPAAKSAPSTAPPAVTEGAARISIKPPSALQPSGLDDNGEASEPELDAALDAMLGEIAPAETGERPITEELRLKRQKERALSGEAGLDDLFADFDPSDADRAADPLASDDELFFVDDDEDDDEDDAEVATAAAEPSSEPEIFIDDEDDEDAVAQEPYDDEDYTAIAENGYQHELSDDEDDLDRELDMVFAPIVERPVDSSRIAVSSGRGRRGRRTHVKPKEDTGSIDSQPVSETGDFSPFDDVGFLDTMHSSSETPLSAESLSEPPPGRRSGASLRPSEADIAAAQAKATPSTAPPTFDFDFEDADVPLAKPLDLDGSPSFDLPDLEFEQAASKHKKSG